MAVDKRGQCSQIFFFHLLELLRLGQHLLNEQRVNVIFLDNRLALLFAQHTKNAHTDGIIRVSEGSLRYLIEQPWLVRDSPEFIEQFFVDPFFRSGTNPVDEVEQQFNPETPYPHQSA